MSFSTTFGAAVLLGVLMAGAAQAQQPGNRDGYQFKTLRSGYGLSSAQLMYQAQNDLLGVRQTITNNTTNNSTTAAESVTTINTDCGNDTVCQIDAVFNRNGQGNQNANQTPTTSASNASGK